MPLRFAIVDRVSEGWSAGLGWCVSMRQALDCGRALTSCPEWFLSMGNPRPSGLLGLNKMRCQRQGEKRLRIRDDAYSTLFTGRNH